MAYSFPAHFSDQFSYIKYFISSYILKDMNLSKFAKRIKQTERETGWTCAEAARKVEDSP
jgi:hypothetical protein